MVLTAHWPPARAVDDLAIYCPALAGLPDAIAPWLAILPVHDANAVLLEALEGAAFSAAPTRPDFAGVCLVDPFRQRRKVLQAVIDAGIGGIANLPTVATFAGPVLGDLEALRVGLDRELDGLTEAAAMGLATAAVVTDRAMLSRAEQGGFDTVLMCEPSGALSILK
ncbi:phosphoenolpyruvate hydrolase family protein [Acuticoccus sp. M5D2P5]|uniref:phosphoenolpyruvate hydrolase family protein n=1 Tax=Acuticoccus kalidii TaxID=2910977 RepID=UPI001F1F197D|nr:phosphoenolpyruvate hydrolase family protein [Acuticoccus kalidii]